MCLLLNSFSFLDLLVKRFDVFLCLMSGELEASRLIVLLLVLLVFLVLKCFGIVEIDGLNVGKR